MTKTRSATYAPVSVRGALVALTLVGALLAALPFAVHAETQGHETRFSRATEGLVQGNPERAERELSALIDAQGYAPGALQNLGLSQLAQGELGRGILALSRAQLLSPRDAAIGRALADARTRAGVDAPHQSPLSRLAGLLSVRAWIAWGSAAFALFCAGVVLVALRTRAQRAFRALSLGSGVATFACALAVSAWGAQAERAVVVAKDAVAQISPFSGAARAFSLREGDTLDAPEARAGFLRVRGPDGESGWVDAAKLAYVVPRSGSTR